VSMIEISALVQGIVSISAFVLGGVGLALRRWTLGALGWFLGTYFARIAIGNVAREHPDFDVMKAVTSPYVIFIHTLIILILMCGIIAELVIREWGHWDEKEIRDDLHR
jgi:hypothetical protein